MVMFGEFMKKVCPILKKDWLKIFEDFYKNEILNRCVNGTYLCLIPKKLEGPIIRL